MICVAKIPSTATESANGCDNTPVATKSCCCDKKAWHKGWKLVVSSPNQF